MNTILLKRHRNSPEGASAGLRGGTLNMKKNNDEKKWKQFKHIIVYGMLILKYTDWSPLEVAKTPVHYSEY